MLKALVTRLGKIVFDFSITSEATLAVELAGALSHGAMGCWLMQRQRSNVFRETNLWIFSNQKWHAHDKMKITVLDIKILVYSSNLNIKY